MARIYRPEYAVLRTLKDASGKPLRDDRGKVVREVVRGPDGKPVYRQGRR